MENLKEREKKGDALSTIILLVMKADDQRTTKINGAKLYIFYTFFLRIIYRFILLSGLFYWTFMF